MPPRWRLVNHIPALMGILFLGPVPSMAHARVEIAAWVEGYNRERPHSFLGYSTQAAFAAELYKQWPTSLRS